MNSEAAFDQFLAVVRSEEEGSDDFELVFRRVFEQLQQKPDNRVYLDEMLKLAYLWAMWRRHNEEQDRWSKVVGEVVKDVEAERRIKAMSESVIEKACTDTHITVGRNHLLKIAHKRFGEPSLEQLAVIQSCTDPDQVERWLDRAIEVASWTEVFQD